MASKKKINTAQRKTRNSVRDTSARNNGASYRNGNGKNQYDDRSSSTPHKPDFDKYDWKNALSLEDLEKHYSVLIGNLGIWHNELFLSDPDESPKRFYRKGTEEFRNLLIMLTGLKSNAANDLVPIINANLNKLKDRRGLRIDPDYLLFENGVVNIATGKKLSTKVNTDFISKVPHDYENFNRKRNTPGEEVVDILTGGDPGLKRGIAILCAQIMYEGVRDGSFFNIKNIGTGKGELLGHLLADIPGCCNVSSLTPKAMAGRFGMKGLENKVANICFNTPHEVIPSNVASIIQTVSSRFSSIQVEDYDGFHPFKGPHPVIVLISENDLEVDNPTTSWINHIVVLDLGIDDTMECNRAINIVQEHKEEVIQYLIWLGVREISEIHNAGKTCLPECVLAHREFLLIRAKALETFLKEQKIDRVEQFPRLEIDTLLNKFNEFRVSLGLSPYTKTKFTRELRGIYPLLDTKNMGKDHNGVQRRGFAVRATEITYPRPGVIGFPPFPEDRVKQAVEMGCENIEAEEEIIKESE